MMARRDTGLAWADCASTDRIAAPKKTALFIMVTTFDLQFLRRYPQIVRDMRACL